MKGVVPGAVGLPPGQGGLPLSEATRWALGRRACPWGQRGFALGKGVAQSKKVVPVATRQPFLNQTLGPFQSGLPLRRQGWL